MQVRHALTDDILTAVILWQTAKRNRRDGTR